MDRLRKIECFLLRALLIFYCFFNNFLLCLLEAEARIAAAARSHACALIPPSVVIHSTLVLTVVVFPLVYRLTNIQGILHLLDKLLSRKILRMQLARTAEQKVDFVFEGCQRCVLQRR